MIIARTICALDMSTKERYWEQSFAWLQWMQNKYVQHFDINGRAIDAQHGLSQGLAPIYGPDPARDNLLRIRRWLLKQQVGSDGLPLFTRTMLRNDPELHDCRDKDSDLTTGLICSKNGVLTKKSLLQDYSAQDVGLDEKIWDFLLRNGASNPHGHDELRKLRDSRKIMDKEAAVTQSTPFQYDDDYDAAPDDEQAFLGAARGIKRSHEHIDDTQAASASKRYQSDLEQGYDEYTSCVNDEGHDMRRMSKSPL